LLFTFLNVDIFAYYTTTHIYQQAFDNWLHLGEFSPMADYTKLDLDEASEILGLYGITHIDEIVPLSLGISNSNYKICTHKGDYLLKVSNDKNTDELTGEMRILQHLSDQGFDLSLTPFEKNGGGTVYHIGDKFGVVFPFVRGIPPGPSDITCCEIGRSLAKLHMVNIEKTKVGTLRDHEEVGFGATQIIAYVASKNCPQDFKDAFHSLFPHSLHSFTEINWNDSIIHGDLYYDNTLFQNESLEIILDFEQGGIGESILDLGISISGTCLEKGMIIAPLVKSFMRGYQSVRELPKEERAHLADAICLGLLSIALWRIKRFKEKNMNPLMSDSYKELLYRAQLFSTLVKNEKLL
jgi:homoserine kinase type II